MSTTTHSEQETKNLAAEFARTLHGGEVIFLEGDLGSGKTTFVRGVAEALGFVEPVRSPTFTIVNRYPVTQGAIRQILHVDLYRLKDPSELTALALEEELRRPDTVVFIEWADHADGLLGSPTYAIIFSVHDLEHQIILPLLPR
ncbi:tRNA (adenosine(37)-N6)-threonylcarbamoyltransferase complex ATPase subunit type 1 TsaE [Candidatus Uhrbacteria bacterium]|nr:tRNA (adenosine(37)-N6)-threonylcarbamoyltransferase complex ATPase subunit type 1 TsaE [Candidatus Uhrbacteria bacterium]